MANLLSWTGGIFGKKQEEKKPLFQPAPVAKPLQQIARPVAPAFSSLSKLFQEKQSALNMPIKSTPFQPPRPLQLAQPKPAQTLRPAPFQDMPMTLKAENGNIPNLTPKSPQVKPQAMIQPMPAPIKPVLQPVRPNSNFPQITPAQKTSFDQKSIASAEKIIQSGGTGAPYAPAVVQQAQDNVAKNKVLNNGYSQPVNMDAAVNKHTGVRVSEEDLFKPVNERSNEANRQVARNLLSNRAVLQEGDGLFGTGLFKSSNSDEVNRKNADIDRRIDELAKQTDDPEIAQMAGYSQQSIDNMAKIQQESDAERGKIISNLGMTQDVDGETKGFFTDYLNPVGSEGIFGEKSIAKNTKVVDDVSQKYNDFIDRNVDNNQNDYVDSGQMKNDFVEYAKNSGRVFETDDDVQQAFDEWAKSENGFQSTYKQWADAGGIDGEKENLLSQAGRFVTKLPVGMVTAPLTSARDVREAVTGERLLTDENGNITDEQELTGLQRAGAAGNAFVNTAGLAFGGSGTLLKSLATQGGKEVVKQTAKQGLKQTLAGVLKDALKEGGEEAAQSLLTDLQYNGGFDAQTLNRALESAKLGAAGGAVMSGAGKLVDGVKSGVNDIKAYHTNMTAAELQQANQAGFAKVPDALTTKGRAVSRLTNALDGVAKDGPTSGDVKFAKQTKQIFTEINSIRETQGLSPLTERQTTAYESRLSHLSKHTKDGYTTRQLAEYAYDAIAGKKAIALPGQRGSNNTLTASKLKVADAVGNNSHMSVALGEGEISGGTAIKSISPRNESQIKNYQRQMADNSGSNLVVTSSLPSGKGDAGINSELQQAAGNNIVANPEQKVNSDMNFNAKSYVKQQVKAQGADLVSRTKNRLGIGIPVKQRIGDFFAEAKHFLVDDAIAYERYIKGKGNKKLRAELREGVDRVRSSDMIARQFAEDNGMKAIGKMQNADVQEFSQVLVAKRAAELESRGVKTGRDLKSDQALIKSVGEKYVEQEQIVRDYTDKMLDYSVEHGLISPELRNKLVTENPNYVPMNRIMDEINENSGQKSKQLGNLSKQTVVQKIEGSDLDVQNPIESLLINTTRMINEGQRNKVAAQLFDTPAFRENTIAEGQKPRAGYDALHYLVDGEKISYEVPALVAKEMKNLNSALPDFAQKTISVIGAPTRMLRTGATGANPMFALSNVVRDQLQTVITGNVKANIKGTPKALVAAFDPLSPLGKKYRAELSRVGIIGSEYRQTYGYKPGELMAELQRTSKLPKQTLGRLRHPIDTLADVIGRTEYFTRAQQYFGTDGDITAKAQAARNNTLNFSRAGSTTRILNKIIPFLNAGVQGGRITVKAFRDRPIRTTFVTAAFAGVGLAANGLNGNSEERKALLARINDVEKRQNIIVFTPDAHYDPKTNRVEGVMKIPIPQQLYPLFDGINNVKGKPEDYLRVAGNIFTALSGIDAANPVNQLTPTAVKPFIEWGLNKSTFTGNDLVSEYDKNKAPEDKGAQHSTGFARDVARTTGVAAPVVDNFVQSWGGGLAKDATTAFTDNPDNARDGGGVQQIIGHGLNRRFGSATITSQYDLQAEKAKEYKATIKQSEMYKTMTPDQREAVLNAIDSDTQAIAGFNAKIEQQKDTTKSLSTRQKTLAQGFNADDYIANVANGNKTFNGTEIGGTVSNGDGYSVEKNNDNIQRIKRSDGQPARYAGDVTGLLENSDPLFNKTYVKSLSMTQSEYERLQEGNDWNSVQHSDNAMVDVLSYELEKAQDGYAKGIKSRQDIESLTNEIQRVKERVNIDNVNKVFSTAGTIDGKNNSELLQAMKDTGMTAYDLEKLYNETNLTTWRKLNDSVLQSLLAAYDAVRTGGKVSGKNGDKKSNKYFSKAGGGSNRKASGKKAAASAANGMKSLASLTSQLNKIRVKGSGSNKSIAATKYAPPALIKANLQKYATKSTPKITIKNKEQYNVG